MPELEDALRAYAAFVERDHHPRSVDDVIATSPSRQGPPLGRGPRLVLAAALVLVAALVLGLALAHATDGNHETITTRPSTPTSTSTSTSTTVSSTTTIPATSSSTTVPTTSSTSPVTSTTVSTRALPLAPACDPNLKGPGLRPTLIFLGCATSADNIDHLVWTSWTPTKATATAEHHVNDCLPSCAGGTFTTYPVVVTIYDPGYVPSYGDALVFRRLTVVPTTPVGSAESAYDGPAASRPPGQSDWGLVPA